MNTVKNISIYLITQCISLYVDYVKPLLCPRNGIIKQFAIEDITGIKHLSNGNYLIRYKGKSYIQQNANVVNKIKHMRIYSNSNSNSTSNSNSNRTSTSTTVLPMKLQEDIKEFISLFIDDDGNLMKELTFSLLNSHYNISIYAITKIIITTDLYLEYVINKTNT
jgi:hypothetical protein